MDTSGLLCFLHQDEPHHQTAVELMINPKISFLTHSYVLAELVALAIVRRLNRSIVLSYTQELVNN